MVLSINKEDLTRKKPLPIVEEQGDLMGGVNKFMMNLNTTIGNAGKLLGQYNDIKGKLKPNEPVNNPKPVNQEPPPNPTPPPKPVEPPKEAEFKTMDKRKKAEDLFKELHEAIKPHITKLKFITGADLLKLALQPDNKEKVIAEIEKRL